MKRRTLAMLAVQYVALCAPALLGDGAAAQGGTPTEIHFLDTKSGCRILNAGTWALHGSTVQVRRRIFMDRSTNIEGFAGSDAWIVSVVDSDVDLAASAGKAWGTFVKVFDTIPATIYGTYSGVVVDGVFSGTATGRGTGSLEGYRFDAVTQQMPIAELPGGNPCPPGSLGRTGQTLDSTLTLDPPITTSATE